MTLLKMKDLVVTETLGENASGKEQTRTTTVQGVFVDVTVGSKLAVVGGVPVGSVFAYIEADGYGVTWGDAEVTTISDGTREIRVSTIVPAENPRTGVLHHIEAVGGV